jgi:hypothetical protein
VLECTSGEHCPGDQVCCLSLAGVPNSVATECRRNCGAMGGRDPQLCSSDDECPRARPSCRPTALGVSLCTR